jgi:hypothetical protein
MPVFLLGPLASWSCFPTLPWASQAASHEVQPPNRPSEEPSDLSGLKPYGPPWVSLFFREFGCLFWGPASCLTFPRTIWSEWTWSEQPSLACSKIPLQCLLWTVNPYYFLCFVVHFVFQLNSVSLSSFSQISSSNCCFQLTFSSATLFNHSLIIIRVPIVWILFSIVILEMCSRYFDPDNNNHLLSQ